MKPIQQRPFFQAATVQSGSGSGYDGISSLRLHLHRWIAVILALLFFGCTATPNQKKDRQLYRAMQLERRALALEYGNATNCHELQRIIDRNGIERSKLEGYIP